MGRQEQLIKELVLSKVAKCGQCGDEYELSDVNILGHKEDLWFLMLICGQCHQAVGVAAVVKEQALAAAAGEGDNVRQIESGAAAGDGGGTQPRPVTDSDVADIQEFLQHFDGDFKRLFDERA